MGLSASLRNVIEPLITFAGENRRRCNALHTMWRITHAKLVGLQGESARENGEYAVRKLWLRRRPCYSRV